MRAKAKQPSIAQSPLSIPPPFDPAPAELAQLLSTLDPCHVYIIHTDHHPAWFKKRIFAVPVMLNLCIVALLLWRAWIITPHYLHILASFLGNENDTTIHFAAHSWTQLMAKVGRRMASFTMDFVLVRIVGPWPWTFFAEQPGNPVSWRWQIGFRDHEVYVRMSRGWGAKDLLGAAQGSSGRAGRQSPFFTTRILPAIDASRLRESTGYMLMDKDFDLDFGAMTVATQLLDSKHITPAPLAKSVFVYVGEQPNGQWAVWDCSRLDQGSDTEARNKLVEFRDRLTAMGKEDLFFRWVELIQYESSLPGGFTQERQMAAFDKTKNLFDQQGVDWSTVSKDIVDLVSMPRK